MIYGLQPGGSHVSSSLWQEYDVCVQFGAATDSYDSEGTITHVASKDKYPSLDQLVAALNHFRGEIDQIPPIYSAISIQGKRAYDYARQGIPLPKPIEPRKVRIDSLELVQYDDDGGDALLRVTCGGGTYMRSLVHDLGLTLGCYAHMTGLKRTRQGPFTLEHCLALVQKGEDGYQHRQLLSLEDVRRKTRTPNS
ncbi:pseudouridine synthase [Dichotomocladium elegans]|nr:pseudouridine synthase [Dichotomocladium elegans]